MYLRLFSVLASASDPIEVLHVEKAARGDHRPPSKFGRQFLNKKDIGHHAQCSMQESTRHCKGCPHGDRVISKGCIDRLLQVTIASKNAGKTKKHASISNVSCITRANSGDPVTAVRIRSLMHLGCSHSRLPAQTPARLALSSPRSSCSFPCPKSPSNPPLGLSKQRRSGLTWTYARYLIRLMRFYMHDDLLYRRS